MTELLLGTASWSAKSWVGNFYPEGAKPGEFLTHYAERFCTVEVDSTWYRMPTPRMVAGWDAKTPAGFIFSAKVPKVITHEKQLRDCDAELAEFLDTMSLLGDKLGPLLFQFPYFRKAEMASVDDFLERLRPFIARLPEGFNFAIEVRNKPWLKPPLLDALRARNIALTLIDHPWMPTARQYAHLPDLMTADFAYVRWLGDRYRIEQTTTEWDRLVVERDQQTEWWAEALADLTSGIERTHAYYNNHYAGCAYQSAGLFAGVWRARYGSDALRLPAAAPPLQTTLPG